ncbi:NADPH-dependent curcumin reductase CurA [Thermocatellispora tengchongensis]|uniref:NADPH-dependent curcumin reductase CurA n=1 Tax=Thermocatellispora tengchongensis TaxID=1073253 RepID=A0A840PIK8_9ACTN|nr:hypothetical protein [Thermocatellispora tengchongensis]MBB5137641.1 NADPH-dependent curcumin reductase CurA [Thermocatellispora tengchongensis]
MVLAPEGNGLRLGDLVTHRQGKARIRRVSAHQCVALDMLDDALPQPVARLNQGRTACATLIRLGGLSPDDRVFVSGGAGANRSRHDKSPGCAARAT